MEQNLLYLIGGGIGGALITSIVGPYIVQSKDRRAARAAVLKAIMAVERAQWHETDCATLHNRIAELKATALIARADRKLVDYYSRIAKVTYHSAEEHDIEDDGELIWMLPATMTKFSGDTLEALVRTLWHPTKTRLLRGATLKKLQKQEVSVKKELDQQKISTQWDAR